MKFEFTSTITGSSKYLSFGLSDDDDMVSSYLTLSSLAAIKTLSYRKMQFYILSTLENT